MNKKIVFFGSWGTGATALRCLLENGYSVEYVCTQYDPSSEDSLFNVVHDIALENNIEVVESYSELLVAGLKWEEYIGVAAAYSRAFGSDILSVLRIINIHLSLLPQYAGHSPIVWAIRNGDSTIGVTAHSVEEVDSGGILYQDEIEIDYSLPLDTFIEGVNKLAAQVLLNALRGNRRVITDTTSGPIFPRLRFPRHFLTRQLTELSRYLNRPKIQVFTGNRAEFGILFPLLLMATRQYRVELVVSGAHVLSEWMTVKEVRERLTGTEVLIIELPLVLSEQYLRDKNDQMAYSQTFSEVYDGYIREQWEASKLDKPQFVVVLGDRIEAFGFACAAFFLNIPIVHVSGGDVANVPYFDTHVRHAISKIAHLHLTTNEKSARVLEQLGEEQWRIQSVGHMSLDYDKMGLLVSKQELVEKYNLKGDKVVIITVHPDHSMDSRENIIMFGEVLEAILQVRKTHDFNVILTAPNNDPGFIRILEYIKDLAQQRDDIIKVVGNLGTIDYMSLMKNFCTIVVGNSSSGLIETPYFLVPTINVGNRQTDRVRADNVLDVGNNIELVVEYLGYALQNYSEIVERFRTKQYYFGDGQASEKALEFVQQCFETREDDILFKKFVLQKG